MYASSGNPPGGALFPCVVDEKTAANTHEHVAITRASIVLPDPTELSVDKAMHHNGTVQRSDIWFNQTSKNSSETDSSLEPTSAAYKEMPSPISGSRMELKPPVFDIQHASEDRSRKRGRPTPSCLDVKTSPDRCWSTNELDDSREEDSPVPDTEHDYRTRQERKLDRQKVLRIKRKREMIDLQKKLADSRAGPVIQNPMELQPSDSALKNEYCKLVISNGVNMLKTEKLMTDLEKTKEMLFEARNQLAETKQSSVLYAQAVLSALTAECLSESCKRTLSHVKTQFSAELASTRIELLRLSGVNEKLTKTVESERAHTAVLIAALESKHKLEIDRLHSSYASATNNLTLGGRHLLNHDRQAFAPWNNLPGNYFP